MNVYYSVSHEQIQAYLYTHWCRWREISTLLISSTH
ncbi:hypothetical protein [Clostridium botulinum]